MTFELLHKAVLYATVALGLLPLALSGEVPLLGVLGAYGALVASWFYDAPVQRVEAHTRWWTLGTLGALLVLGVLGWASGNYLLYAILFAMVMVVTRLFQSRSSRDVFQLYGLTFVSMIAGAVINPTLSFVFIFVGYVVLLVWGLILLHLQRDIEGLQAEQEALGERPADLLWKARGVVTPRFLVGSSVLALGIFASSLVIFFFFPRLGMGFFFSQGRQGQSVSGFSDRIELGHFGTIKDNLRVIMRVELPDEPENAHRTLRMRGISFDRYDGRVWSKTTGGDMRELPREELGRWVVPYDNAGVWRLPGERLRQSIYLEPLEMDQRMIFGEARVQALEIDNPEIDRLRRHPVRFYMDRFSGDISTRALSDVALRYHAESYLPARAASLLRAAEGEPPPPVRHLYLQLPEGLDPRVGELARAIVGDAANDFDKAVAIEQHLLANYGYSTEGGQDPTRPLESFLFDRKQGHCEYFSTAMVVLLRTLGIPARPANGFYGGAWNPFGRFYAIRQADAHSWTEVWFPGYGWIGFDATPPTEVLVPAQGGVLGTVQEWVDSLRLQWYKWVVEYDLEKQIAFFRALGEAMGGLRDALPQPSGSSRSPSAWKKGFKEWAQRPLTWVILGSPLALFLLWRFGFFGLVWAFLRGRLRRRGPAPGGAVGELYGRMLRALTRQGVGRLPQETPSELAARLKRTGYPAGAEVERLTRAFEAVRYAGRDEVEREEVTRLQADLRAVRRVKVE